MDNKDSLLKKSPFANRFVFLLGMLLIVVGYYMLHGNYKYNRSGIDVLIPLVLLIAGIILMAAAVIGYIVQKKHRYIYYQIAYIETCQNAANCSETIQEFISNFDEMMEAIKAFERKNNSYMKYMEFSSEKERNDFQWHLRDAVEREASRGMSLMKNKYSNSLENKKQIYMDFVDSIKRASSRFEGDETWDFVERTVNKVYRASGATTPAHTELFRSHRTFIAPVIEKPVIRIEDIDGMDGHVFEYWCADLLKSNGFSNVKVTPGSGDQGIDITAVKDGVKYAVQCKNYSKQLGNTPVQEAHAGKAFYGCHVAVVMTNSTFSPGAIALAEKTGVLLWDRAVVERMMIQE